MSEYIVDVTGLEIGDYAISREEIVRCRDCRHRVAFEQPLNLERVFCGLRDSLYAVEDEGFCAWGVRRSE